MSRGWRLFFWIVLLLVGLNFAAPDSIGAGPISAWNPSVAWADLDSDDLDPSLHHTILSHDDILSGCIVTAGLALVGHFLSSAGSNSNPQGPSPSLRIPRSPPAN